MSIVGTQSVSLSDLMKLGVPALNSMAQGQQSSIAPSYMVIAALKALTDGQKGAQQPMPQGTIKDQLVAQTAPPAGIAQLQQPMQAPPPVKGFSGADGESQVKGRWVDSLPEGAGIHAIMRYLRNPNRKPILDELLERREEPPALPKGTQATMPNVPPMPIPEIPGYESAVVPPQTAAPVAPPEPNARVRNSITASASSRGVGAAGNSPLAKYETLNPTPSAASFPLDIPRNQQLEDAATKYASPDDARLAELKGAESRAGLGAFARGMLDTRRGRGFGAVFGPAAADSNDAMEARADKRREYEDRRADVARELGIKLGEQGRQDFFKKTEYGDSRAAAAAAAELSNKKFANESIGRENAETLDREKMAMTEHIAAREAALKAEANSIAREIKKEGATEKNLLRLQSQQQAAVKMAQDSVKIAADVNVALGMATPEAEMARRKIYNDTYTKAFPPGLEKLLYEGFGIPMPQPVVRKAY